MRSAAIVVGLFVLGASSAGVASQASGASRDEASFKVVLLGTAGGPTMNAERNGISTLVVAGPEQLLFDCGRNLTSAMVRLGIEPADVSKVFLTHLHSDHIVSLPELYLFPWASQGRRVPLQVWGPTGTRAMARHLEEAFAFDVHVRRDVDEKYPAAGITMRATDIREGVVYQANGVTVTAFLVDHGPVKPAFGYRVDYRGHSLVMSGDTKPTDNLVKFAQGVDVLIHELGRSKQDPALSGPADEILPNTRQTRGQIRTIAEHHTDGREAGRVFDRVKPKLAVFSHYNASPAAILPLVRQSYAGAVEFGDDLMTIDIGERVEVHRAAPVVK